MRSRTALLLTAGLALSINPASAQNAAPVGPSFDCSKARDPVGATVCSDPALRRLDLQFVQAYQALRYQIPEDQRALLRQDAVTFNGYVIQTCQLPRSGVPDAATMSRAAFCMAQAYSAKRKDYVRLLQGEALEEASRDVVQQLGLQARLAATGLYEGPEVKLDGSFGPATRDAIKRFQEQRRLPATGFMNAATASALSGSTKPSALGNTASSQTNEPRMPVFNPTNLDGVGRTSQEGASASAVAPTVPVPQSAIVGQNTSPVATPTQREAVVATISPAPPVGAAVERSPSTNSTSQVIQSQPLANVNRPQSAVSATDAACDAVEEAKEALRVDIFDYKMGQVSKARLSINARGKNVCAWGMATSSTEIGDRTIIVIEDNAFLCRQRSDAARMNAADLLRDNYVFVGKFSEISGDVVILENCVFHSMRRNGNSR